MSNVFFYIVNVLTMACVCIHIIYANPVYMHALMFISVFRSPFSERSESYQHLAYTYKRIPNDLISMDSFNKAHFFNENLKTRSQTFLTSPKISRRGE